jgi:hypothetical protein
VGTLVERTTRFLLLLHLHGDRSADAVDAAMRKAIATLPDELCRSITWDQGAEMANHIDFTVATDIPSTSATRMPRGNAVRTRTPTASCANTSPRASISRRSALPNSDRSNAASTVALARLSAI